MIAMLLLFVFAGILMILGLPALSMIAGAMMWQARNGPKWIVVLAAVAVAMAVYVVGQVISAWMRRGWTPDWAQQQRLQEEETKQADGRIVKHRDRLVLPFIRKAIISTIYVRSFLRESMMSAKRNGMSKIEARWALAENMVVQHGACRECVLAL